ncbi:hypothetical protein B0H13DRAFT_1879236 [Mycena leptocephala]|nr:hypothetical protein B0H13DRAFT_1879236 [Mycena leptocephala]
MFSAFFLSFQSLTSPVGVDESKPATSSCAMSSIWSPSRMNGWAIGHLLDPSLLTCPQELNVTFQPVFLYQGACNMLARRQAIAGKCTIIWDQHIELIRSLMGSTFRRKYAAPLTFSQNASAIYSLFASMCTYLSTNTSDAT